MQVTITNENVLELRVGPEEKRRTGQHGPDRIRLLGDTPMTASIFSKV
jgi:hypothetical protein